ncbi:MAG: NADH-quinone oxidoreductase subunit J, partial [Halothiobacillus sp.]
AQSFGFTAFPTPAPAAAGGSNTLALGSVLYTQFVYPFEIAAFILLVAIVAAIALAHRKRDGVHYQDIDAQVRVRKIDRVRVLKMSSAEPNPATSDLPITTGVAPRD